MYEAVHVAPEGGSTTARFASTAARFGYDGVVVRNHGDEQAATPPEGIDDRYGVEVVHGVEIRADTASRASGFLGSHRPLRTIVLVHGGDPAINAFAVTQEAVDVLAHPMEGNGDLNHVLVRQAAENGVRLEFDLSPVLRSRGRERSRAIGKLRKLAELTRKYNVRHVASADPVSHLELRRPEELVAVGEAIGLDADLIEDGLREWRRLAARNRGRLDDTFVTPGVERGAYEES